MKKKYYWAVAFCSLLFGILLLLHACGKMDDTYRQFIEDGETIYIAKADSLKVRLGRNRVELSWFLLSDPKIKSYKVYYNNRQDSIYTQFRKVYEIDTVKLIIDELSEGTHYFEIFTYDGLGNSSVKADISGRAYGSMYQKGLLNATITKSFFVQNDLKVIWNKNQPEGLVNVDLEYTNRLGEMIMKRLTSLHGDTCVLREFPVDGTFRFRSGFIPDTLAIDTFYTDFQRVQIR